MKHLNMNETFRRWPLGMSTYPAWADLYGPFFHEWRGNAIPFDDWLYERLRPLLVAPGRYEYAMHIGRRIEWANRRDGSVAECIRKARREVGCGLRRVTLLDGTVIREWGAS